MIACVFREENEVVPQVEQAILTLLPVFSVAMGTM